MALAGKEVVHDFRLRHHSRRTERTVRAFAELEDAVDWGLDTYGGDAFRIRYLEVAQIENEDRNSAQRPM
jgi:hypothetical protein